VFAWVAAESGVVRAIRSDLRGRWGLTRAQHHAIGYWRRGRSMSTTT
jgi:NADPH-dependent ferric siderophore reductase